MVAASRACLGSRFRIQGRDPATGLDCIGLALVALKAAGSEPDAPRDYSLSGKGLAERLEAGLQTAGCAPVASVRPGDLIIFEPAPGQAHLAVASTQGVIHAHLGIGRIVEGPPDPAWVRRSTWRFGETI